MIAQLRKWQLFLQSTDNPAHNPGEAVPVEEFEEHVRRLHANGDLLFSQEYGALKPQAEFTWNATLAQENRHKNRYNNVVAYDHSRVKLSPIQGVPGSDYINANFLDGYQKKRAYIASQGPLPETEDDFWRMIWEQDSKIIVMVCVNYFITLFTNLPYNFLIWRWWIEDQLILKIGHSVQSPKETFATYKSFFFISFWESSTSTWRWPEENDLEPRYCFTA